MKKEVIVIYDPKELDEFTPIAKKAAENPDFLIVYIHDPARGKVEVEVKYRDNNLT